MVGTFSTASAVTYSVTFKLIWSFHENASDVGIFKHFLWLHLYLV